MLPAFYLAGLCEKAVSVKGTRPVNAGRGGVNPVTNQTDGFYDAQNLLTYIPDQAAMRLYAGTVLTAS